ncbi:MAG: DUF1499 domain-containing protein [Alphaproteobacteria bacterium]|nr:DUF1499 domain-containing protein [Alphaproteobacteria bacterium]
MSVLKIILLIVIALPILGVGSFYFLAQQSKNDDAPGLVDGVLAECPSSPNCVRSEAGTLPTHAVEALPLSVWDQLAAVVEQTGGVITVQNENYLAAEYYSKLFGFVDDVEFRKAFDAVHVRSASRVGHSDMGANKKRISELREASQE